MGIGAGHRHLPAFERLAQRIEHNALEFGQLVQKQHAKVGHRDFARAHFQASAGQRRHAGRMVGRSERTGAADSSAFQRSRDRGDHADFQRLAGGQFGQDAGQAARQQALARARWADHQQVGAD